MAAAVQFFLYIYSTQQVQDSVFCMALQRPMDKEREGGRERGGEVEVGRGGKGGVQLLAGIRYLNPILKSIGLQRC